MAPGAKTNDLLYISNYDADTVAVYSYPQDKLVGTLTGFHEPDGICADKQGDVWIVNNEESQSSEDVVEYKHGGEKPIATVYDPGEIPVSCSVDPMTGNLAVTNISTYSSGPGSVAIYAHAKGSAVLYPVTKMLEVYFCGFDDKGNLFVDGVGSHGFLFAELPKGQKTFTSITLKGGTIIYPGDVQWDGKHVAVGDQEYQLVGSPREYDSAIYQTTGAGGKIVGTTVLAGSHDVVGFWIAGNVVIGGDRSPYGYSVPDDVEFYKYPAGGKPTKTLNKGFDQPFGVAISQ
ncbi:MAG: hypothetical protein WA814_00660 [Candidatus Baltobacteraceae bacterium]